MVTASKRHAWMRGECQIWLKENHPAVYKKIRQFSARYMKGGGHRENLVLLSINRVMQIMYQERYQEILHESRERFQNGHNRGALSRIAWDIAFEIRDSQKEKCKC